MASWIFAMVLLLLLGVGLAVSGVYNFYQWQTNEALDQALITATARVDALSGEMQIHKEEANRANALARILTKERDSLGARVAQLEAREKANLSQLASMRGERDRLQAKVREWEDFGEEVERTRSLTYQQLINVSGERDRALARVREWEQTSTQIAAELARAESQQSAVGGGGADLGGLLQLIGFLAGF